MYWRNSWQFFWKTNCQCKKIIIVGSRVCVQEIDLKKPQNFCIFGNWVLLFITLIKEFIWLKKCLHSLCCTSAASTAFTGFAAFAWLTLPSQLSLRLRSFHGHCSLRCFHCLHSFALLPLYSQLSLLYRFLRSFRFATTTFTAFASLPQPPLLSQPLQLSMPSSVGVREERRQHWLWRHWRLWWQQKYSEGNKGSVCSEGSGSVGKETKAV